MRTAAVAERNYANPHALTAFFNGSATTTYSYDAIGNLATTTGAATSTFMWDYRNRMLRAWVGGVTSTYQYDHTIARMRQVVGSTTTDYPNKFYSVSTTTQSGTGTSTAYIWHGDVLVATIEQRLVNGVASGTATTYYYHPDHLGSTNTVTNSAGTVKQALDYYPYGAQRINTGMDASDRRFIGQFGDDATSLDYLNARYYDPARGQFTSQDPTHLAIGNIAEIRAVTGLSQQEYLRDPQLLNSYSYIRTEEITLCGSKIQKVSTSKFPVRQQFRGEASLRD
jgi:RHS repeat-associated protein